MYLVTDSYDQDTKSSIQSAIKSGEDLSLFAKSPNSSEYSFCLRYVLKEIEKEVSTYKNPVYKIVPANDRLKQKYADLGADENSILNKIFNKYRI